MRRFLSIKEQTWHSIVLVLVMLLSSLLFVEANRKNAIANAAAPDILTTTQYPLDKDVQHIILSLGAIQFGQDQVDALNNLLTHESNFYPEAINPTSGACGIFQSDPCQKLLNVCGSLNNVSCQINWGFNYISSRYGNPKNAWFFWKHQFPHWY